jgi:putative restriction endonuclease
MTTADDELKRRAALWKELQALGANDVDPQFLRARGVYGGAQGIWVDKRNTAVVSTDGNGVTVGVLHTGRHYPDDLSNDGMIYHYPTTQRPPARDAAEVQATKNAAELALPIFVVLPGQTRSSRRSVRLAWVTDFDDGTRQFLILFGDEEPHYDRAANTESPFQLFAGHGVRMTSAKARLGQQRFRFQVFAQYGCKCAVCSITHPSLMKAAHICGYAHNGSDDWRNGVPLCSTHHDAFDAHLFAIRPETLEIVTMPGVTPDSIGIGTTAFSSLRQRPHLEALNWRFEQTYLIWNLTK